MLFLAGMSSIAITLGARSFGDRVTTALTVATDLVGVAIVALSVYLSYRFATRLSASLGETGTLVFLRLTAFILLCVGVSIFWGGVMGLVEPLLAI